MWIIRGTIFLNVPATLKERNPNTLSPVMHIHPFPSSEVLIVMCQMNPMADEQDETKTWAHSWELLCWMTHANTTRIGGFQNMLVELLEEGSPWTFSHCIIRLTFDIPALNYWAGTASHVQPITFNRMVTNTLFKKCKFTQFFIHTHTHAHKSVLNGYQVYCSISFLFNSLWF